MKKIDFRNVYAEMSDSDLIKGMSEIEDSQSTGFLVEDGFVRKIMKETSQGQSADLYITIVNFTSEAAFRWLKLVKENETKD